MDATTMNTEQFIYQIYYFEQNLRVGNYYVRISTAKMPLKCWGRYNHIGLLECEPGYTPQSIRDTRRGRIVDAWYRCRAGKTWRSATARAWRSAVLAAYELSAGQMADYADGLAEAYGPQL